jgi:ubiquitin-conjugating enzyme E2 variant
MTVQRAFETFMISAVAAGGAALGTSLAATAAPGGLGLTVVLGLLAGYVAADLLSGLAHWGADNFGSPDTPWLGPTFILPFRNHHADPLEITRHGFVEANGATAILVAPLLWLAWWALPAEPGSGWTAFAQAAMLALWPAILMTNQIHKWAHMPEPPRWIRPFQRSRLILSPAHHDRHHTAPFDTYYCITTGWLNGPIERLGLFAGPQRLIESLSRRLSAPNG